MAKIGDTIQRLIREADEDDDFDDRTIESVISYLTSDEVGVTKEKHLHVLSMQDLPPTLNIVKKRLVLAAFRPQSNADRKHQQGPAIETLVDSANLESEGDGKGTGSKTPPQTPADELVPSPICKLLSSSVLAQTPVDHGHNSYLESEVSGCDGKGTGSKTPLQISTDELSSPVLAGNLSTRSVSKINLSVTAEDSDEETAELRKIDTSISSTILMNASVQRTESSGSEVTITAEKYYTPKQWSEMSEIEKKRSNNILELYQKACDIGLNPKKPVFMEEKDNVKKITSHTRKHRIIKDATRASERIKNGPVKHYHTGDDDDGQPPKKRVRSRNPQSSEDDDAENEDELEDSLLDSSIEFLVNEDKNRIRLHGQDISKYPTALPEFGEKAKRQLMKPVHEREMKSILEDCYYFIKKKTGGTYLSKNEYDAFSKTVVEEYPALQEDTANPPWLLFKKSLSGSLRARRARAKKKAAARAAKAARKARATDGEVNNPTSSQTTESSGKPSSAESENSNSNLESIVLSTQLEELKGEKNVRKIVPLLKATQLERKSLFNKMPHEKLMEDFPYLKLSDMVLYDFTLIKKLTVEAIQITTDANIAKLQDFFDICGSEEICKFRTVEKLHEHFITAAVKKNGAKPVFIIADKLEVFQSLQSSEVQAPFVVIHTAHCDFTNEEVIKSGAVMMKGRLLFTLAGQNLTAARACMVLIAVYAVHQVEYPRPYMEFLRALERFSTGSCAPSVFGNTKAKFSRLISLMNSKSK